MVDGPQLTPGSAIHPAGAPAGRSPLHSAVPAILSLIVPGLGQLVNGQLKKGISYILIDIGLWFANIFVWAALLTGSVLGIVSVSFLTGASELF